MLYQHLATHTAGIYKIHKIDGSNHRDHCLVFCDVLCLLLRSAGVGRTGTLITIQSMMKMIEHEKKVDIFNFVLNMRHQRNLMVQTEVSAADAEVIMQHTTDACCIIKGIKKPIGEEGLLSPVV